METMKKIFRDVWSLAFIFALSAAIPFGVIAGRELACRYVADCDDAKCCAAGCDACRCCDGACRACPKTEATE